MTEGPDGEDVGRVYYDTAAEEYVGGEMLGWDGQWHDLPATSIIADGERISKAAAKRWREEFGMRL